MERDKMEACKELLIEGYTDAKQAGHFGASATLLVGARLLSVLFDIKEAIMALVIDDDEKAQIEKNMKLEDLLMRASTVLSTLDEEQSKLYDEIREVVGS